MITATRARGQRTHRVRAYALPPPAFPFLPRKRCAVAGVQRQRLGKPGPGRRGPRGGRGPRLDTLLPGRRLAAAPARAGLGGRGTALTGRGPRAIKSVTIRSKSEHYSVAQKYNPIRFCLRTLVLRRPSSKGVGSGEGDALRIDADRTDRERKQSGSGRTVFCWQPPTVLLRYARATPPT